MPGGKGCLVTRQYPNKVVTILRIQEEPLLVRCFFRSHRQGGLASFPGSQLPGRLGVCLDTLWADLYPHSFVPRLAPNRGEIHT